MDLRYNQDTMLRSLPPLNLSGPSPSMAPTLERRAPSPLPPLSGPNDASRPSSTSTQSSNTLAFQHPTVSLPGLSTLAAVALPTNSQIRYGQVLLSVARLMCIYRPPFNSINHQQHFTMTASPTPTSVSGQSNPVSNRPYTVPCSCMNPLSDKQCLCTYTLPTHFLLVHFMALENC